MSSTMRAAVLHGPGDVRVEERPMPVPAADQVLVEVSHCGVCGTDLHLVIEGWGRPGTIGGHEWSGRVVDVGDAVELVAAGDAVIGSGPQSCGTCGPCRDGRPSVCARRPAAGVGGESGAFADYVCVHETAVVRAPKGLDLRTAALSEPLAVALHAVTRSGVLPGQRALVTGAGPIGALVLLALRARGITDIVVSEPNPGRQALASHLGATTVVTPDELDVPSIAEPDRIVDAWVDVALECSGKASAMAAASAQLTRAGTLVLVGSGIESPRFDPNRILLNELVITGAFEYDAGGIAEAAALLSSGAVDADAVLEEADVGLDGLLAAMEGLARGSITGKVLVNPRLLEGT